MGFNKIVRSNSAYGFRPSPPKPTNMKTDILSLDLHRFDSDSFVIPLNNSLMFNMFDWNIRAISIILSVYQHELLRLLSKCFLRKLIKIFGKNNLKFSLEDDGLRKSFVFLKNDDYSLFQLHYVSLWSVFTLEQDYDITIRLVYDKKLSNSTTDFSEITVEFYYYHRLALINSLPKGLFKSVNTYDILNYKNLNDKYISNYFNGYFDNCIETIKMYKDKFIN